MAEKILLDVELKGLESDLDKLKQINSSIKELKQNLKDNKDVDSAAAEAAKINLKQQQDAYRQLQKEVKAEAQAVKEGTNTLAKKRAELAKLNKELDNVEIGSQRFKELTEESKKLRDEIKGADEATGRFQANVGNYKGAIVDAFQQMGINVGGLTDNIEKARSAIQLTNTTIGGTNKMLKLLKIALISTGIGAVVVVLGSIITFLASTQKGIDAVNKVLIPLGTILQRVLGIVQNVGAAFAKIFSGEARQGWEDLKETIGGVGDELRSALEDGRKLVNLTISLRARSLELLANQGRITREITEQKQILEDVNRSESDRRAAGERAVQLAEALRDLQLRELDIQIEQLKIKQRQNDTDFEGQKELLELINQRAEVEAATNERTQEFRNKISEFIRIEREKEIAFNEQITELERARYTDALTNIQSIISAYDKIIDQQLTIAENARLAESEDFRPFDEEFIDDIPEVINSLASLQQQELELARSTTDQIKGNYAERLAALKTLHDNQLINDQQYAERKAEINQMITADSIGALRNVATEGSAIQKGLFVFEKILAVKNAFLSLQAGLAKTAGAAPFPANIPLLIGFVAQTAGLISSISSIVVPQTPKFARGVIGLNGAGTETSDSINARLSKGESVMTAKATKVFAPVLADMERMVGNSPNVQLGNKRFAQGIISAGQFNPRTQFPSNIDQIIEQTVRSVAQIPVVVAEGDITATQTRVRKIKVAGDL